MSPPWSDLRRATLRGAGWAGLALGLALLVAVAAGLWLGRREIGRERAARDAFPMVSGQVRLEGLGAPIGIDRDARGIPHIVSPNEADAWFGLGFAHAQDRLAQMLLLRQIARGRASEWLGEDGLASDRLIRTLGIPRLAERQAASLSADAQSLLSSYAAGVNARVARIRAGRSAPPLALPPGVLEPDPERAPEPAVEAAVKGAAEEAVKGAAKDAREHAEGGDAEAAAPPPPRSDAAEPWTVADSLAIAKLVAWAAGASHERAVVLSDLIERLGSMGARPFFPGGEHELGLALPLDEPDALPAGDHDPTPRRNLWELASFRASAWVLPGRFTASGAPVLVAELAVAPTAPSLLYEAHVRGGSRLDIAGVTIPGIPVFWAGRNPDVAWAVAPLPVATVDLFKESLRRADGLDEDGQAEEREQEELEEEEQETEAAEAEGAAASGSTAPGAEDAGSEVLYQNGSRWVPIEERWEEIAVGPPGRDRRVEQLRVRATRHGPLINGLLSDDTSRTPLSLAWTGARVDGDPIGGMLALARARDAQGVRAALAAHHEPPVEVVYADREGDIGLQMAGWLPQRTLPSGLSPVPGRLRAFDWRGGIAYESLPHQEIHTRSSGVDVLRGWVLSTGTRLDEELEGGQLEWLWRSYARAFRLRALLAELVPANPVELRAAAALQDDVAANVDPQLLATLLDLAGSPPQLSPEAQEVADLLRAWDGNAGTESRGAAAFQLLIGHLLEEMLEPTIGPELMHRYLSLPDVDPAVLAQTLVIGAMRSGRTGSWTDREVVSAAVREGLRRTWMSLSYRLGHNRERWTWGRLHTLRFRPFASTDPEAPAASRELGPIPMAGQAASLARSVPDLSTFSSRRASTFRMAVDLASQDRMLTTLAPGQSEHPGHPHFDDGVAAWLEGRPSLVVTSPFLLEEASVERLVLEPAQ